jgi:heat shock protein HslJ
MKRTFWTAMLAAILLLAGPATVEVSQARLAAQAPGGIPAFVWTLTSFPGVGEIAQPSYSIQFMPDGTVAIGADCNRAAGIWTGGDGALDITVAMQSLALCAEDSLEQRYLAALNGVTSYTLTGTTLVLHGATGDLPFAI